MAIKMRILYYSKSKKFEEIAKLIQNEYDLAINAVDKIPSAYPCDKERLVILGLSAKKDLDDTFRLFVRELTKARSQNTAMIIDGDSAVADKVKEQLNLAGTNVIDNVLYIKTGLFNSKVSDEEKKQVLDWVHGIVEELK